jgi:DNA-binding CsgD family transcriptional regulator
MQKFRTFREAVRQSEIPLRHRIAVFFVVSALTLFFGVMTILSVTGAFSMRAREIRQALAAEQRHFVEDAGKMLDDTAAMAVVLSREMTTEIQSFLWEKEADFSELEGNGGYLLELEEKLLPSLLSALQAAKVSGVFMVLNATVNPALPNAKFSRAGLYIRSGEPGVSGFYFYRLFLRGFRSLAIKYGISLQSQWELEFDVHDKVFYNRVLAVYAADQGIPLSRLFMWSGGGALGKEDDVLVLCSLPVIDPQGTVLGVCGFEISAMHFRLSFPSGNASLPGMVRLLGEPDEKGLSLSALLLAGSLKKRRSFVSSGRLVEKGETNGLRIFVPDSGGEELVGLREELALYQKTSPFAFQKHAVITAIPRSAFDEAVNSQRRLMTGIFSLFLVVGGVFAVLMSKRIVRPLTFQMESLGPDIAVHEFRTNIPEVDLLIKRLLEAHSAGKELEGEALMREGLFHDFITAVKGLTPAERVLFNQFAGDKTNAEIMKDLHMAAGTLKVHSLHIYQKLCITSRGELKLYVNLLKKSGREKEIFP